MIYFVRAVLPDGLVKIGHAKVPHHFARLFGLANMSPVSITMLALAEGDKRQEEALHAQFQSDRMWGEWFTPSSRLLEFIGALPHDPLVDAMNRRLLARFVAIKKDARPLPVRKSSERRTQCIAKTQEGFGPQCARTSGYGPSGFYCMQHDPTAIKPKYTVAELMGNRMAHGDAP